MLKSYVAGMRFAILLEKRLELRCFSVNFEKFLRSLFYRTTPMAAFEEIYLDVLIMKRK